MSKDAHHKCQETVLVTVAETLRSIVAMREAMCTTVTALRVVGDSKVAERILLWDNELARMARNLRSIRDAHTRASAEAAEVAQTDVGKALVLLLQATVDGSIHNVRERAIELGLKPQD